MVRQFDQDGPINPDGRDVHVRAETEAVEVGIESVIFEFTLWAAGPAASLIIGVSGVIPPLRVIVFVLIGVMPGVIFSIMKTRADSYFSALQQRIQAYASQLDNFMEQRVIILKNVAGLIDRAVDLDKDVMKTVAFYRSGGRGTPGKDLSELNDNLNSAFSKIAVSFEAYPNLRAHASIADAMSQNNSLQREITVARELYNNAVLEWNMAVFSWPTKKIVAAKMKLKTIIPFTISLETKAEARSKVF